MRGGYQIIVRRKGSTVFNKVVYNRGEADRIYGEQLLEMDHECYITLSTEDAILISAGPRN